ncbi:unnamed protein product, partial [Cyprideis torosa]
ISDRLRVFETSLKGVEFALKNLEDTTNSQISWEVRFDRLQDYLRPIWSLYDRWVTYVEHRATLEESTLIDMAEAVVSHHPMSSHSLIWQAHDVVVPWADGVRLGLFEHLHQLLKKSSNICSLNMSPQQYMYALYKLIMTTEVKAFSMMTFSWMLLREAGKGNFTKEVVLATEARENRMKEQLDAVKLNMKGLDTYFYRCDPNVFIEGKNYWQDPSRRYDYIQYESGQFFGERKECETTKVDSWWRWFVHCSYCFCLCDDPGPRSDRYFSLREVTAIPGNIITGIRLEKVDRVFHIRIQEGKILRGGEVDRETVRWTEVQGFKLSEAKEDQDYSVLSFEKRAMDLDDLIAPRGYVVTGVKFRELGMHLGISIKVAPADFSTGALREDMAYWFDNGNTDAMEQNPRERMTLEEPDVPTKSVLKSRIDSAPDTFIEFQPSSMLKDVAQTTVPFLDAQAVSPKGMTWLRGIGLYHKGMT